MDLWIKGTEPRQGAGGFGGGETVAKGSGMSMCLSFYSERKKYQDESAPIIECGPRWNGSRSYRPMAHHYATNVWGGKERANTHTKRTLAKLGKSVRNYGCAPTSAERRMCSRSPQKSQVRDSDRITRIDVNM